MTTELSHTRFVAGSRYMIPIFGNLSGAYRPLSWQTLEDICTNSDLRSKA